VRSTSPVIAHDVRIVPGDPVEVQRSLFSLVCVGIVEYVPTVTAAGPPAFRERRLHSCSLTRPCRVGV